MPGMKKKSKIESPRIASVNPSSLRRAKSRKVRLERELIEPANPAFQVFSFSLIPSILSKSPPRRLGVLARVLGFQAV